MHLIIKHAFLQFYLRLANKTSFTYSVYATMALNLAVAVAIWLLYCLQCRPLPAFWNPTMYPDASCLKTAVTYYVPASLVRPVPVSFVHSLSANHSWAFAEHPHRLYHPLASHPSPVEHASQSLTAPGCYCCRLSWKRRRNRVLPSPHRPPRVRGEPRFLIYSRQDGDNIGSRVECGDHGSKRTFSEGRVAEARQWISQQLHVVDASFLAVQETEFCPRSPGQSAARCAKA